MVQFMKNSDFENVNIFSFKINLNHILDNVVGYKKLDNEDIADVLEYFSYEHTRNFVTILYIC
jgi:hypothetical protein